MCDVLIRRVNSTVKEVLFLEARKGERNGISCRRSLCWAKLTDVTCTNWSLPQTKTRGDTQCEMGELNCVLQRDWMASQRLMPTCVFGSPMVRPAMLLVWGASPVSEKAASLTCCVLPIRCRLQAVRTGKSLPRRAQGLPRRSSRVI